MRYFTNLPTTLFQISPGKFKTPAEFVALTDIRTNVRFKKEVLANISLYDEYIMKDYDTIEIISERYYRTPYYHWIIMLFNDRYDYINDLPLKPEALDAFTKEKYDPEYLDQIYGETEDTLLVEIKRNGKNIDINGETVRVLNKTTGAVQVRPVVSLDRYDPILESNVKIFKFTDDGLELNTKTHKLDYGAIPDKTFVTAKFKLLNENEEKRKLKLINPQYMSVVLDNFRALING